MAKDTLTRSDIEAGNPNFYGWIPHDLRTRDERDIHDALVVAMPEFQIIYGDSGPAATLGTETEAKLYKYSKLANGGHHFPNLNQKSVGACVGHDKANAEWLLQSIEAYRLGDLEQVVLPYEPYGYAQMRVCAGISGNSDGGTGSGAAEACKKFGMLDSRLPGLPKFVRTATEVDFLQATDRAWGRRGAPQEWIEQGVKHVIQTTALIRDTKSAIQALKNGYPIMTASSWGGLMECPVVDGVLLQKRGRNWYHSWLCPAWQLHPTLGNIFMMLNSWGWGAHGDPPDDSPPGSCWLLEKDFAIVVGEGDSYAISGANGFPEATPNWYLGA